MPGSTPSPKEAAHKAWPFGDRDPVFCLVVLDLHLYFVALRCYPPRFLAFCPGLATATPSAMGVIHLLVQIPTLVRREVQPHCQREERQKNCKPLRLSNSGSSRTGCGLGGHEGFFFVPWGDFVSRSQPITAVGHRENGLITGSGSAQSDTRGPPQDRSIT